MMESECWVHVRVSASLFPFYSSPRGSAQTASAAEARELVSACGCEQKTSRFRICTIVSQHLQRPQGIVAPSPRPQGRSSAVTPRATRSHAQSIAGLRLMPQRSESRHCKALQLEQVLAEACAACCRQSRKHRRVRSPCAQSLAQT